MVPGEPTAALALQDQALQHHESQAHLQIVLVSPLQNLWWAYGAWRAWN